MPPAKASAKGKIAEAAEESAKNDETETDADVYTSAVTGSGIERLKELLHENEQLQEYHLPSTIATFNRLFRFFCLLIGLFLLPLWFLLSIIISPFIIIFNFRCKFYDFFPLQMFYFLL